MKERRTIWGESWSSKIVRLCPLALFSILQSQQRTEITESLSFQAIKDPKKPQSYITPIIFLLNLWNKTCQDLPRVTRQVSDRSNKGLRPPGSEPRPHSLLPWNLIFNTLKVSVKSKHNYIKSLALLMKSNRKIYCLSEASPEKLGNREKLWLSIWGGEGRGTKRFVDNKITSNPNWPTFRSPEPVNLTSVNSVLQSKHLKIYFGLSITRRFFLPVVCSSFLCMTTSTPRTPVLLELILQALDRKSVA